MRLWLGRSESAGMLLISSELCLRGEPRPVFFLWRPQLPDPKDDHVLELAVAADSPTIVTHNTRHFRKAEAFGVPVLTPKQFLETLG